MLAVVQRRVAAVVLAAALLGCGGDPPIDDPEAAATFDPAAPALEPAEAPPLRYEIQPGDTLWDIAAQHGTTPAAIAEHNPLITPEDLTVGDIILVPRG